MIVGLDDDHEYYVDANSRSVPIATVLLNYRPVGDEGPALKVTRVYATKAPTAGKVGNQHFNPFIINTV
jgi:hypothetical protein